MSAPALHQFIPSFVPRDAIGAHALHVQSVLRELGLSSEMYVADAAPAYQAVSLPYDRYKGRPGEWMLYQASTGHEMGEWLARRHQPKIVNYHNVTPPGLIAPWEPGLAAEVAEGRRQVAKLAAASDHAIAVSRYNQSELSAFGYRSTSMVPLLVDLDSLHTEVDPVTAGWLERSKERGGIDILFVGRIVPNKAQHDLIKALAAYRRTYDGSARLHLVGGASSPNYLRALRRFVAALDLWDAVDLAGSVSDAERSAYYRGADVFVCLSDHEGVCVPLLEAQHGGVPVVAYGSSAIPETMGAGGLLLDAKDPALVAAAIHRVVSDPGVRTRLVAAGRIRAEEFNLDRTRKLFAARIEAILRGDGSGAENGDR